jgi:leader peptidase (prepilin peptidase)/N-methyltransferase
MLEAILAGVFGLLIGSFLNVCIYRLPRDLSVVHPRSFCPGCERTIPWHQNIPVLSFLILRGRCPGCHSSIPWRYPVVELLTGLLFFAGVLVHGVTPEAAKFCTLAAILVTLIFTDLEERILPDEFTKGGTVLGIVFAAFVPLEPFIMTWILPRTWPPWSYSVAEACLGAGVTSGMLWLTGTLYEKIRHKEGLGFGDVKMVAMMGAFFGLPRALLAICFGAVAGSIVGLAFVAIARKDASTYELPFGSFLGAAALLTLIFSGPSALIR